MTVARAPETPRGRAAVEGREDGALLFEILLALTVLTVGVLAFLGSFAGQSRAFQDQNERDEASFALTSLAEELYAQPLDDVYANYHGLQRDVPALTGVNSATAQIVVTCHVDETSIPAEFGGLTDLDGEPGSDSTDVSASYEVLPVHLGLTWLARGTARTEELWLVLGRDET